MKKVSQMLIVPCRANWVRIDQPDQDDQGRDRWRITAMVPKSDKKTIKALQDAEAKVAQAFGPKARPDMFKYRPIKDGLDKIKAEKEKAELNGSEYEGGSNYYKDFVYFEAKTIHQPGTFGPRGGGDRIPPGEIRTGDYIKVSVTMKPYQRDGNRGITIYLNNVQLVRRGEVWEEIADAVGFADGSEFEDETDDSFPDDVPFDTADTAAAESRWL